MGFFQITCYLMSIVVSLFFFSSNITGRLDIDVTEPDGRLALWREDEYIAAEEYYIFNSRNMEINKTYISYDDGKSYKLLRDALDCNEFIIRSEDFSDKVCIRFISNGNFISRAFRINFSDNTFTDT